MACRISLVVMVLVCACGPHKRSPQTTPVQPTDREDDHFIPDIEDRCMVLPRCADEFFVDDDGCPDVVVSFAAGSAELDDGARSTLAEIAGELDARKEIIELQVIGLSGKNEASALGRERAEAVKKSLVGEGVPEKLLRTAAEESGKEEPGYVMFEVVCK